MVRDIDVEEVVFLTARHKLGMYLVIALVNLIELLSLWVVELIRRGEKYETYLGNVSYPNTSRYSF
jgi:hypothetical protein